MLELNPLQQIFMFFFAVLFGALLTNVKKFSPFPLSRWYRLSILDNKLITDKKYNFTEESIRRIRRNRIILSFIILNFAPILYFIVIYTLVLNNKNFPILEEWMYYLLATLFSLSSFMFYRIYRIVVVILKDKAFSDVWALEYGGGKGGIKDYEPEFIWIDFFWIIIYFCLPWFFIGSVKIFTIFW